jgi:hypothetical protein
MPMSYPIFTSQAQEDDPSLYAYPISVGSPPMHPAQSFVQALVMPTNSDIKVQ